MSASLRHVEADQIAVVPDGLIEVEDAHLHEPGPQNASQSHVSILLLRLREISHANLA